MSSDGPILVFDGVCVLCSRSVQFVLRHDRDERFRFATTHSNIGAAMMRRAGLDPSAPASVLLSVDDRLFVDSAALVRTLLRLGFSWQMLGAVIWLVPRPIRDVVYRAVAKRRYRWFGRTEACYLPEAGESARFLS